MLMCLFTPHLCVCVCVCVCVFQVCCPASTVTRPPFLKREEASSAQRPHPLTQTRTCPSDHLTVTNSERSTWAVSVTPPVDGPTRSSLNLRTSWRIVLLVLFSLKPAEAKHVHFEVIINLSGRLRLFHTGDTETMKLTAETFWGWSIWCFNPDPHA